MLPFIRYMDIMLSKLNFPRTQNIHFLFGGGRCLFFKLSLRVLFVSKCRYLVFYATELRNHTRIAFTTGAALLNLLQML